MRRTAIVIWLVVLGACSAPARSDVRVDAAVRTTAEDTETVAPETTSTEQASIPKFSPEDLAPLQTCRKDAECALVSNGCCNADLEAVNQRHLDEVQARFHCPGGCPRPRLPQLSVGEARCVKRQCVVRYVSTGKDTRAPSYGEF